MTGTPIHTLKPGDLFMVFVDRDNITQRVGMRVEDADGSGTGRLRVPIVWMDSGILATLDRDAIVWRESKQSAGVRP